MEESYRTEPSAWRYQIRLRRVSEYCSMQYIVDPEAQFSHISEDIRCEMFSPIYHDGMVCRLRRKSLPFLGKTTVHLIFSHRLAQGLPLRISIWTDLCLLRASRTRKTSLNSQLIYIVRTGRSSNAVNGTIR
jgi:hypothetical protein